MLTLRAIGRFQLLDEAGADCTPSGQKSRAVLALLAMAPGYSRSRTYLQDKIWSDRGSAQAAASLRQALTDIRKSFGANSFVISADRISVSLNAIQFRVSFAAAEAANATSDSELFEDLDVADAEFEDWLRGQRGSQNSSANFSSLNYAPSQQVICLRSTGAETGNGPGVRRAILAMMCKSLLENTDLRIVNLDFSPGADCAGHHGEGFSVNLSVDQLDPSLILGMTVVDQRSNQVQFVEQEQISWAPNEGLKSTKVMRLVWKTVNAITELTSSKEGSDYRLNAQRHFNTAKKLTFNMNKIDLAAADQMCSQAYNLDPRGSHLAWRAFIRTLSLFQFQSDRFLPEQFSIPSLTQTALEKFPTDSSALAMAAHAEYLFAGSKRSALRFAELALDNNRLNPLAWAAVSNIQTVGGDYEAGLAAGTKASELAFGGKSSYYFDFYRCMAATGEADYSRAADLAQQAALLSPKFAAPRRYLVALNLALQRFDEARMAAEDLRTIEPDFNLQKFLERSYPINTLRQLPIFETVQSIITTRADEFIHGV